MRDITKMGIIFGAVIGLLWQYKIVRYPICALFLVATASVVMDYHTESRLPDDIKGAYSYDVRVVKEPDLHWSRENLTYDIEGEFTNTYSKTIQRFVLNAHLWDCPTLENEAKNCVLVKSLAWMPGPDVRVQDTWKFTHTLVFSNAPKVVNYPRVTFDVTGVLVDSNNPGRNN